MEIQSNKSTSQLSDDVEMARSKWLDASERESTLAASLFQPGSGYGDPDARLQDEHRLNTAKHEVERLFREYHDLASRITNSKMLELQKSQRLATWISIAVATAVGFSTIFSTVVTLLGLVCT